MESSARHSATLLGVFVVLASVGPLDSRRSDGGLQSIPQTSALPTVRIDVDPGDLEALQRAIVDGDPDLGRRSGGNKPFVRASYVDENGVAHDSEIGYRGLGQWHHHPEKPSLRVKIRKQSHDGGHRIIELQRPEGALAMRNWLPDRLGRELGLLSARLEHVRVFINGDYKGVYVRNIRPGRPMLMAAGRIPGTLFKADNWSESPWGRPGAWKQRGETPEAVALFGEFLTSMQQPISASSVASVQSYLDLDAYTRWTALMIITGSVHADDYHNHLLHVAPERGLVEAVPWDVCGYGMQATPDSAIEVIRHPLANWLSRDPRWVHRRNVLLHEVLNGALSPTEQIRILRAELARLLPDLRADPHLASLEALPDPTPKDAGGHGLSSWPAMSLPVKQMEFERWIRKRGAYIMSHLSNASVAVKANPSLPGFSRVTVFGNVAVEVHDGASKRPKQLYPGLSKDWKVFEMQTHARYPLLVFAPVPAPLEYDVPGRPDSLRFTNAITGEVVEPTSVAPTIEYGLSTIHPNTFDELTQPEGPIVIGPGDVRLSASLHVGAKQELVVKAGTRISMGPNVSILSRGRIVVEGTATNPVHIEPADPQAPWGTLGVVGAASEGSRFSHMHLRGGGDGTDGRVHFKGMLNIYGSDGVVIQDCAFGPNARGDDAVNIASSTFVVKDSSWNGALADALDIDMSDGVIERSRFMNSGNDGLDVMGGTVIIRESRMHGNGDKGISIGERASVLGEGLHIARNRIGVEVKDDSWVALSRSRLERNDIGWHAYRKKKFYRGGGRALLIDSDISGLNKETDVFLEPFSNLLLVRTDLRLDKPVDGLDTAEAVPQPWRRWLAKFVDRTDQSRESTASSGPSNGELSPSSLAQRASTR